MTITFAADEIVSTTDFQKSGKTIMNNLKSGEKRHYGVMRNGKIEAVMVPLSTAKKYETDYLSELYEAYNHDMDAVLEHLEIAEIVESQKDEDTISLDEVKKEFLTDI